MLFICSHKTCPEYVEPCIFSMDDMNHAIGRTTVCPVGEDEDAMEIDELMTFFCLIVGSRTYDNYETFSKPRGTCFLEWKKPWYSHQF